MICFEVFINGEMRCTAGVGEFGVVNAHLGWYHRTQDGEVVETDHNGEFHVYGVNDCESGREKYVKWLADMVEMKPRDEFLVRVIESTSADPPVPEDIDLGPDWEQRAKEGRRQIYEKLREEFESD